MGKINISTNPPEFENWLNEKLNKHNVNYEVNVQIMRNVILEFQYEMDSPDNREKLLQKILSNPELKRNIRKAKLDEIYSRVSE